jgi:hypothetical protein
VVVHGKKKTYIFLGISELLLIFLFIKVLSVDIGYTAGIIVLQFFYVFFIKKYNDNVERNKIYNILSSSEFIVLCFNGIGGLEDEEYQKIQTVLGEIINGKIGFMGRVYLFLSYEQNKITIRYIFNKRQDYELYVEKKIIVMQKIEEMEYVGNGVSMVYICNT